MICFEQSKRCAVDPHTSHVGGNEPVTVSCGELVSSSCGFIHHFVKLDRRQAACLLHLKLILVRKVFAEMKQLCVGTLNSAGDGAAGFF